MSRPKEVEERIRIERAVFRVSSFFIGDYNLDQAIGQSFELLGSLAGADRIYLYRIHQKAKLMQITHQHIISNSKNISASASTMTYDNYPWWIDQLRSNEIIHFDDVTQLPEQATTEKELLTAQGVRSLVAYPISIEGRLHGYIGLDHISSQKKWTQADLELFKIAADIIGESFSSGPRGEGKQDPNTFVVKPTYLVSATNTLADGVDNFFILRPGKSPVRRVKENQRQLGSFSV